MPAVGPRLTIVAGLVVVPGLLASCGDEGEREDPAAGLPEDITVTSREFEGGTQVQNSAGDTAYTGPCPPRGTHHYRFTVYALSEPTGLEEGAELDAALDAIEERAVARGTLQGTYAS